MATTTLTSAGITREDITRISIVCDLIAANYSCNEIQTFASYSVLYKWENYQFAQKVLAEKLAAAGFDEISRECGQKILSLLHAPATKTLRLISFFS